MNLETLQQEPDKMRQRISAVLSDKYHYKPEPIESERIDLGIDWGSVDTDEVLGTAPKEFDDADSTHPNATESKCDGKSTHIDIDLINQTLSSAGGDLTLRGSKTYDIVKDESYLTLKLANPREDWVKEPFKHNICHFRFHQIKNEEGEEWDMMHRQVNEVYRGQGIASSMISLSEDFFKKRAQEAGIKQVMTANIAQVNVLTMFLKKDFAPATAEDEEKINRLLNGDPSLVVVTGPETKYDERLRNYIFERNKYYGDDGLVKPEIEEIFRDGTRYEELLEMSFRINLKKVIK